MRKVNIRSASSFLAEQHRLLRMEYEAEKKAFHEVADNLGLNRLIENGNAWFPISVIRNYHNSLNKRIIEIRRSKEDEDIDHNFEYGRPVVFFSADDREGISEVPISGTVSYVDDDCMAIVISETVNLSIISNFSQIGVMLSFDETSYRVMFEALSRTSSAQGRLGELRDLIYSHRPVALRMIAPMTVPYLNADQQRAVNLVLSAKDVAVVHGPPGTGKTTTLVEAIYETLRRETQVLVCAQSNMAVDLICERLSDRGLNVLRIGNPSRVNDKMLSSTYERRFEDHPDYPTLWSIRKQIREMRRSSKRSDQWHRKMDSLKRTATELELRINNDLFSQASVIASTLVGSSHQVLEDKHFSSLFIDEASQALEAACWIPIAKAGRVIFAGDHCQLPPVVKCYEAALQGLAVSLMERIVEYHPEAVTLLSEQYRMHEQIMRFSSDWFYNGKLVASTEVRYRSILEYDSPIQWIDSDLKQEKDDDNVNNLSFKEAVRGATFGKINVDEALLTITTLKNYVEKIGIDRIIDENIDIALISPYKAQVRYLRKLLKGTPFFKAIRHLVSVNSVDGFQGRESDVVIISLVRSNDYGQIGFLRDLRRMNVAMTRARMKLIVIGNVKTLTTHPFYDKLYGYISSLV